MNQRESKPIPEMSHTPTNSGYSLFQKPMYRSQCSDQWYSDIEKAIQSQPQLSWDMGSFMSTLSCGFALGNRTLFQEIQRQPWLSDINADGSIQQNPIPHHGLKGGSAKAIGSRLFELMCDEAEEVCRNRSKIYILLSGGLDSRVIAGVIKHLKDQKKIDCEINAVTWGIQDCRDVYYGKCVAERLGFPWFHAELNQEHFFQNIDLAAKRLGASVSPVHLHRMNWFANIDPDSLVLAGSLGNMIGRGQITSRSMLEVLPINPFNYLNLMIDEAAAEGLKQCKQELKGLRERAGPGLPEYVYREHEQACHFSRGLLCQTMSIINDYCELHQMLSVPQVYSFMWSRHPAVRTDHVYSEVLNLIGSEVASVPWTKTNKGVGKTDKGIQQKLHKQHNRYRNWTHQYLRSQNFDRDEFLHQMSSLNFLDLDRLVTLIDGFTANPNAQPTESGQFSWTIAWLISLNRLMSGLNQNVESWAKRELNLQVQKSESTKAPWSRSVRKFIANNARLRDGVAKIRRKMVTNKFLKRHPIQPDPDLKEKFG